MPELSNDFNLAKLEEMIKRFPEVRQPIAQFWNREIKPSLLQPSSPLRVTHSGSPLGYWSDRRIRRSPLLQALVVACIRTTCDCPTDQVLIK